MCSIFIFFFNDTATTEIYTLSLHDALPIYRGLRARGRGRSRAGGRTPHPRRGRDERGSRRFRRLEHGEEGRPGGLHAGDRKSTRLNSSHSQISYAVFCLKKKKKIK